MFIPFLLGGEKTKLSKKIIALFLCFATLFCTIVPAYAVQVEGIDASGDYQSEISSLWDRYLYTWARNADMSASNTGVPFDLVGRFVAGFSSNLCPSSPDHYHHAERPNDCPCLCCTG